LPNSSPQFHLHYDAHAGIRPAIASTFSLIAKDPRDGIFCPVFASGTLRACISSGRAGISDTVWV